jgi:predicted O-methyltransferase YrrM
LSATAVPDRTVSGATTFTRRPRQDASEVSPRRARRFEDVWPLVSKIDGWLSREQAQALYAAAKTVRPDCWIVEIGSHHGRSTAAQAMGKEESVPMLAIDPFPERRGGGETAFRVFRRNLRDLGLEDEVQLFRGTSEEAARSVRLLFEVAGEEASRRTASEARDSPVARERPAGSGIGLLFIDGLHDRSSVLADVDAWEPEVVEGGLVFFHDAFFRLGVTLALLERHLFNTRFRYLGSVSNMAMFRREEVVGDRAAFRDTLALLGRLRYLARNMLTALGLRCNSKLILRLVPPEDDFEY